MAMDSEKLKRLKKLAEKTDLNDKSLEEFFKKRGARRKPPYGGIATFFRADQRETLDDIDIAIVGVPFDLGTTNRPGARFGPAQVRELSLMTAGPKHHESGIIPGHLAKFADVGDIVFADPWNLEKGTMEIHSYFQNIVKAGVIPLTVGGDHSITYPILKAVGADEPVGLIHIDAHADTAGDISNSRFHHGGPFRNAVLDGALDPERTVQIGIRGRSEWLWDFSYDSGMRVIHIEEFHRMGIDAVVAEARKVVGDGPTYISFDIDSIDPGLAPGTGTPEVGGLLPREVQMIIRGCQGLNLVGADVVEVSPPYDQSGGTAHIGATMLWELLCILTDSIASRRQRGTSGK